MAAWWHRNAASIAPLDDKTRNFVEYMTGRIPLLLQSLFTIGKEFDEAQFLLSPQLTTVRSNILDFYEDTPISSYRRYLDVMQAFILEGTYHTRDRHLYDVRYFYFDEQEVAHSTCGIASQTLMDHYREKRLHTIEVDLWCDTIRSSGNPTVRGYLAEQVCIAAVRRYGLPAVDLNLTSFSRHETFDDVPIWRDFFESNYSRCLFVPKTFNYADIDAAILLVDRPQSTAHLYFIQITIAKKHKNYQDTFYTNQWRKWTNGIPRAYKEGLSSSFIWIDENGPTDPKKKGPVDRRTQSGIMAVHPEYISYHVGIEFVDEKLHQALFRM